MVSQLPIALNGKEVIKWNFNSKIRPKNLDYIREPLERKGIPIEPNDLSFESVYKTETIVTHFFDKLFYEQTQFEVLFVFYL